MLTASDGMPRRRDIVTGIAASGVLLAAGRPASAAIGFAGFAAQFLGSTFGKVAEEFTARSLMRNMGANLAEAEKEMRGAGHPPQNAREWHSRHPSCPDVVTVDDARDCATVVSGMTTGCANVCLLLPTDTRALLACLNESVGLPALYAKAGQSFDETDILRYCTPVVAERRRFGRCGGLVSVFITAGCYRVEIETRETDFAAVSICNPRTRRKLENTQVPLHPTKYVDAGKWRIV